MRLKLWEVVLGSLKVFMSERFETWSVRDYNVRPASKRGHGNWNRDKRERCGILVKFVLGNRSGEEGLDVRER
ncbi:hypothetical protein QG37_03789 [Candidozyma auris]|uniref:Uncharacterized protein n=1 Tax=Candidozyma auris TaxID=498019 RepID=A0A0L0NZ00_CANAR|nr:hypothetical protein QG37_03789 [[Candida] auris]